MWNLKLLGDELSSVYFPVRNKYATDLQVICKNFQLRQKNLNSVRVATVRKKYLENDIFSRSGNFMNGQGNLEGLGKSGNLKKKNGYGSPQKIYLFCSKGERMYFLMR